MFLLLHSLLAERRAFAFVWFEQGVMLSKGRLRPADAGEAVRAAGGAAGDLIFLVAMHEDASERYASCVGIALLSDLPQTWRFDMPLLIEPAEQILGRIARLSEGVSLLQLAERDKLVERAAQINPRVFEELSRLIEEPAQEAPGPLRRDDATALARALSLSRERNAPFGPVLVLATLLRYADLTRPIDSAAFVLRWCTSRDIAPDDREDLVMDLLALDVVNGLLLTPKSDPQQTVPKKEELDFMLRLAEAAAAIRDRISPGGDIYTRHILAVLLRADAPELSAAPYLEQRQIDVGELRRAFARFLSSIRSEPLAQWNEVLNVMSGFDLANKVTTDIWTREDTLGYAKYAQAIADSLLAGNTPPPLTIGIQAPWGQGKTSLMRMIQARLDPAAVDRELPRSALFDAASSVMSTYGDFLAWLRRRNPDEKNGMLPQSQRTIPTVWFNPLYYRDTSQVWAGLAHAILHQLAEQLPTSKAREEFWLRLQMSRVNVGAIRRDVHLWLAATAVPRCLLWIAIGVSILLAPNLPDAAQSLGLGGSAIAAALDLWRAIEKRTLDRRFEKYISEPSYHTELGLLHLVDHDLDRALRLLTGTRPIAVFIDDLDRCDPQTVNQIVLAINQFLSLPNRNVYFILGMDMEMVAAALERAHRDVHGGAGTRGSFGWRFMEKFIQLPFVIPHLDRNTAKRFAIAHLGKPGDPIRGLPRANIEETLEAVERAQSPAEVGYIARRLSLMEVNPADTARLEEQFSRRTTELMQDPESDEVQRIVQIAIADVELNPRIMKRYFCLVRLLRNIQIAMGQVHNADTDRKLVLRTAHLLLNWPQFVQWVRGTGSADLVEHLEEAASNTETPGDWMKELETVLGAALPACFSDPLLHRYVRRLSGDRPGLSEMYDARLF